MESFQQDGALETTAPITSGALTAPQHSRSTDINTVSSEASNILDSYLAIASATMSESGSSIGSSELGSLSTNPTSLSPSETHHYRSDLLTGVRHTPCVKRSILDESAH